MTSASSPTDHGTEQQRIDVSSSTEAEANAKSAEGLQSGSQGAESAGTPSEFLSTAILSSKRASRSSLNHSGGRGKKHVAVLEMVFTVIRLVVSLSRPFVSLANKIVDATLDVTVHTPLSKLMVLTTIRSRKMNEHTTNSTTKIKNLPKVTETDSHINATQHQETQQQPTAFVAKACAMWSRLHSSSQPVKFETLQQGLAEVCASVVKQSERIFTTTTSTDRVLNMVNSMLRWIAKQQDDVLDFSLPLCYHFLTPPRGEVSNRRMSETAARNDTVVVAMESYPPKMLCFCLLVRILLLPVRISGRIIAAFIVLLVQLSPLVWTMVQTMMRALRDVTRLSFFALGLEGAYEWLASFFEAIRDDLEGVSQQSFFRDLQSGAMLLLDRLLLQCSTVWQRLPKRTKNAMEQIRSTLKFM